MMWITGWVLTAAIVGQAFGSPVGYHEAESRPRGAGVVAELGGRPAPRARLQDAALGAEPRLPLPSPQELDAIKKVAQILVMLGEQVIPTILGDIGPPPPHAASCGAAPPPDDAPNDPVTLD